MLVLSRVIRERIQPRAAYEHSHRFLKRHNSETIVDLRDATLPEEPPEPGYDPREHRTPDSPVGNCWAYVHMTRSLFSAGLLGMPMALSHSGYIMGNIALFVAAVLLINGQLTIMRVMNETARRLRVARVSYRYTTGVALRHGPPLMQDMAMCALNMVSMVMIMTQLGICSVYVIFTSDTLRDIMDWSSSQTALFVLFVPYLILLYWMKNLKIVGYISLAGNVLNVVGLATIFVAVFEKPHGGDVAWAEYGLWHVLFSFGTFLFNMSSVGVMLTLDTNMKNPKLLTETYGVITVSIGICAGFSMIFGSMCFWAFGAMHEQVLRFLDFTHPLSLFTMFCFLITVMLTYPIQSYPATAMLVDIIRNWNPQKMPSEGSIQAIEQITRPVFVCITFFVAYQVPGQGPLVSVVGNLFTSLTCLVMPSVLEIGLLYPNHFGRYKWRLVKNIIIIIIGLCSFVFGTKVSATLLHNRRHHQMLFRDSKVDRFL